MISVSISLQTPGAAPSASSSFSLSLNPKSLLTFLSACGLVLIGVSRVAKAYSYAPYSAILGSSLVTVSGVLLLSWRFFLSLIDQWDSRLQAAKSATSGLGGSSVLTTREADIALEAENRDLKGRLEQRQVDYDAAVMLLRATEGAKDQAEAEAVAARAVMTDLVRARDEAQNEKVLAEERAEITKAGERGFAIGMIRFLKGFADVPQMTKALTTKIEAYKNCIIIFSKEAKEAGEKRGAYSEKSRFYFGFPGRLESQAVERPRVERLCGAYLTSQYLLFSQQDTNMQELVQIYGQLGQLYEGAILATEKRLAVGKESVSAKDVSGLVARGAVYKAMWQDLFLCLGSKMSTISTVKDQMQVLKPMLMARIEDFEAEITREGGAGPAVVLSEKEAISSLLDGFLGKEGEECERAPGLRRCTNGQAFSALVQESRRLLETLNTELASLEVLLTVVGEEEKNMNYYLSFEL